MNYATAQDLVAFEAGVKFMWEQGDLPFLTHLCGGNEEQLVRIFADIKEGDWIFSTHRNHYHALLAGIAPDDLRARIYAGKSMFIYSKERNFCVSAVLGGTCGIAAGVAWALREAGSTARVWCFIGDGGEENGKLYEAAMFVEGNCLPCRFIVEDNDQQVATSKADRNRPVINIVDLFECVHRYCYVPTFPHSGSDYPRDKINFRKL